MAKSDSQTLGPWPQVPKGPVFPSTCHTLLTHPGGVVVPLQLMYQHTGLPIALECPESPPPKSCKRGVGSLVLSGSRSEWLSKFIVFRKQAGLERAANVADDGSDGVVRSFLYDTTFTYGEEQQFGLCGGTFATCTGYAIDPTLLVLVNLDTICVET